MLIAIAALAIHLVIGLLMTVVWIIAIVAVVVAAAWALNTLF